MARFAFQMETPQKPYKHKRTPYSSVCEVLTIFQIKWVWQNLKGKRLHFVIAMIISAVTSAAAIVNPKISQIIVDDVIVGVKNSAGVVVHHKEMLIGLLAAMVGVQLAVQSLRYLMVVLLEKSSQFMVIKIKEKLYDNLQNLDMGFYGKFRTGDLMTRLTGDLDLVRHFCAWISYSVVDSVILFTVTISFLFTVNWQLAFALLATAPIIFAVTYIFSKKIGPVFVTLREKLSQLNTCAQENIQGNRVVKAFNRQNFEIEKFGEKNRDFKNINLKAAYTWQKFYPVLEFLAQALSIIIILIGGLLIIKGKLTFGELTIFMTLDWALANPMRNLGMLLNDIQRFFASANKIIELYYAHPAITDLPGAADVKGPAKGGVTFEHVTFKFEKETILDDVSFDIKPGETIGIIGPTGSGKTTIANLIMRFHDVAGGSVKYDGIDVKRYKLACLRSSIAMATQDVFLYSDTVDGNIAYNDPDMSTDAVLRYAEAACCGEFINAMPEGYDTIIGERGVGLSGGQRQRLALARALAKEPALLILDDTTSAVDMETEKTIQENLRNLPFNCTKIIIAQRISSIKDADRILVLRHHKIEEEGSHSELLARHGYYYSINKLQKDGFDTLEEGELNGEK